MEQELRLSGAVVPSRKEGYVVIALAGGSPEEVTLAYVAVQDVDNLIGRMKQIRTQVTAELGHLANSEAAANVCRLDGCGDIIR